MNTKNPQLSYHQIKQAWEISKAQDAKAHRKQIRTLVAQIGSSKEALTSDSALFYIEVLKEACKLFDPGFDAGASRILSKMIPKYLELTGNDKFEIVSETKKSKDLGVGLYIIADPLFKDEAYEKWSGPNFNQLLDMVNDGKAMVFGTMDGLLGKAKLRLIDASEPVLQAKEYKKLIDSTSTNVIKVESGKIAILFADPEVALNVEPGNYKVCAHSIGKGSDFLIVLCKTDDVAVNHLIKLDEMREF